MIDDMAVYIANLGKYNEGYLVGAWFTFPIDEEDVKEKIGLNEQYEEYAIKERSLSSGASDRKATQLTQQVHRQNVEKVVLQETRQNYTKDRRKKVQQTHSVQKNQQTIEKSRNLVTKKGQKKK